MVLFLILVVLLWQGVFCGVSDFWGFLLVGCFWLCFVVVIVSFLIWFGVGGLVWGGLLFGFLLILIFYR